MSRLFDRVRRSHMSIENMTVISADNVAEYIYDKYGVYKESWKDAPCLAPILNPVFIETRKPKNAPAQLPTEWGNQIAWFDKDKRDAYYYWGDAMGADRRMLDRAWELYYKDAHWLMTVVQYIQNGGRLYLGDTAAMYPLDASGKLMRNGIFIIKAMAGGFSSNYANDFFKRKGMTDKEDANVIIRRDDLKPEKYGQSDAIDDCIYPMYNVCMMALSLMHCKNVELIEQEPPPALSKSSMKKYGEPLVKYKVLKVNPMRTVYRSLEPNETEPKETPRPLHICRGHFKDFRDGKGLFGKFKEIYWWDQHLRGNEENGVVVKDYEVEEPEE